MHSSRDALHHMIIIICSSRINIADISNINSTFTGYGSVRTLADHYLTLVERINLLYYLKHKYKYNASWLQKIMMCEITWFKYIARSYIDSLLLRFVAFSFLAI